MDELDMFKKAHQRSKSTDAKIVLNTIIVNVSADSHAMGKKPNDNEQWKVLFADTEIKGLVSKMQYLANKGLQIWQEDVNMIAYYIESQLEQFQGGIVARCAIVRTNPTHSQIGHSSGRELDSRLLIMRHAKDVELHIFLTVTKSTKDEKNNKSSNMLSEPSQQSRSKSPAKFLKQLIANRK